MPRPKILILTVPHGAGHERTARAIRKALIEIEPDADVQVVNALEHCARWFRVYYDSYLIPLKYWPWLWGWIESIQHESKRTGPEWLYRRGGRPLFRYLSGADPDVVVATEAGVCELSAMAKRETDAHFRLLAAPAGVEDADRAWAQAEVDLYSTMPGELASQLESIGAPVARILPCGIPVDPAFASLPARAEARARLGLDSEAPLLLVLFGGTGFGKPDRIVSELGRVQSPFQAVFIAGKNPQLEAKARRLCAGDLRFRVLGWVDNMQEWMAAADLLVSKPGPTTLAEAINCGLPFLAFDPLPGGEVRASLLIEKWQVGCWLKQPRDLFAAVERLLARPEERERLRQNALEMARPRAAYDVAQAILKLAASQERIPTGSSRKQRESSECPGSSASGRPLGHHR